ncbi:MAG: hypothetical protein RSF86_14685 [Angelakisella sp.]
MSNDIIYNMKCVFSNSEDFTEDKTYPVYFSPGGDYLLNDRRKKVQTSVVGIYGDFVQE